MAAVNADSTANGVWRLAGINGFQFLGPMDGRQP
jgi:hypothetical protein